MACLATGPDGDVLIPLRVVSGPASVIVAINARMRTQIGTRPDDAAFGLPLRDWFSGDGKGPPVSEVLARVETQIAAVPGVVEIVALDGRRVGRRVELSARVRVDIDGEAGVVDLREPAVRADGAPPFFLLVGAYSGQVVS